MRDRGQVSLFIIVGILGLIVIGLYLFTQDEELVIVDDQVLVSETLTFDNYIQQCLYEVSDKEIKLMLIQGGYVNVPQSLIYDEFSTINYFTNFSTPNWLYGDFQRIPDFEKNKIDLEDKISNQLEICVSNSQLLNEFYDVNILGEPQVSISFTENFMNVGLDWEINLIDKASKQVSYLTDYVVSIKVPFKKMLDLAEKIVVYESESLFFERLTQDLLFAGHPDVPSTMVDLSCQDKTWKKSQVESTLIDMLRVNLALIPVENTLREESSSDYLNLHYKVPMENNYDTLAVKFGLIPDKFTFEVSPTSGENLRTSTNKGSDILNFFCIQNYKFTYDVVYPILIEISYEDYVLKYTLTSHLIRNSPDRSQQLPSIRNQRSLSSYERNEALCQKSSIPVNINTYSLIDNNLTSLTNSLSNANLTYYCAGYECPLPMTDNSGQVFTKVPDCVNAMIIAESGDHLQAFTTINPKPNDFYELNLRPVLNLNQDKFGFFDIETQQEISLNSYTFNINNFHLNEDYVAYEGNNQSIRILSGADFIYNFRLNAIDGEDLVGTYDGLISISWENLQNAGKILFPVYKSNDSVDLILFSTNQTREVIYQ